jgi:3-oxoadipate enol-lactonase
MRCSHAAIKVGEEFKVSIGGIGLACQVSGVPDAEPMLLVHALGEQAGKWELVTPRFAERCRVFAVDLRGYRRSDWPGTYSFQLMRDDVIALIEQLGLREVLLACHSMGGIVACLVVMTRPDQVARLIIEGAPPPFHRDHPIRERPAGPPGLEV